MGEKYPVGALETTFRIVNHLADVHTSTVTEVSTEFDLPKSTVFDHLDTLEKMGYVSKADRKYSLTSRFLNIGSRHRNNRDIYKTAKSEVAELAQETDKYANLMIEENGFGVILLLITGDTPIHLEYAYEGLYSYLNTTANGKAMLAHMDEQRREAILDRRGLSPTTPYSITDENVFREELAATRERGYSTDEEESIVGMGAVASPVLDREKQVIGSIGLYDSINNMNELLEEGSEQVMEKANIVGINYNSLSDNTGSSTR